MGGISSGHPLAPEGRGEEKAYQEYRARYEQLRNELILRDRQVQSDPFAMARWPSERKVFADRVDQALTEWEVFGHKSQIEARRLGTTQHTGPDDATPDADSGVEMPPAPEDY